MKGTTKESTTQKGGFLNFLRSLVSAGLPLMKDKLTTLVKSVLVPLGLTAAASVTDAVIQKKIYGSGMTALIFFNDIIKIVKSLECAGLLRKDINEAVENEV